MLSTNDIVNDIIVVFYLSPNSKPRAGVVLYVDGLSLWRRGEVIGAVVGGEDELLINIEKVIYM